MDLTITVTSQNRPIAEDVVSETMTSKSMQTLQSRYRIIACMRQEWLFFFYVQQMNKPYF